MGGGGGMEAVWRGTAQSGAERHGAARYGVARQWQKTAHGAMRHVAQRGTMRRKSARGKMRHWHGFCRRLQFVYIHVLTRTRKHAQKHAKNTLTTHAKRAQEL
jgi:hypothetical protein